MPELPFPVTPSQHGVWRRDEQAGAVVADAPAHTDLYINPGGADSGDAESMLNAATLLGTPPAGDFQLSARVTVDFVAQYDAGVLLLWIDERHWAKFCFEFSPAAEPMVVSVVTRERLRRRQRLRRPRPVRVAPRVRVDHVYAFHASTDGRSVASDPASSRSATVLRRAQDRVRGASRPPVTAVVVTVDRIRFMLGSGRRDPRRIVPRRRHRAYTHQAVGDVVPAWMRRGRRRAAWTRASRAAHGVTDSVALRTWPVASDVATPRDLVGPCRRRRLVGRHSSGGTRRGGGCPGRDRRVSRGCDGDARTGGVHAAGREA